MAAINQYQSSINASNTKTHTAVVPAGYGTGNLGVIVIQFRKGGGTVFPGVITAPSGWTLYKSANLSGSGGNYGEAYVYIKPNLSASESNAVFSTVGSCTSESAYFDVSGIKQIIDAFAVSTNTNAGAQTSSAKGASVTVTTKATASFLVDIISILGGTVVPTQATSGWTTASGTSNIIGAATRSVSGINNFTGPTWSWTDASHRYSMFRLAFPTTASNIQPYVVINSGYSVFVQPGQHVTLNANATDYDGSVASYTWSVVSAFNDNNITIPTPNASSCIITIPPTPGRAYVVNVGVTDNQGLASLKARITLVVQNTVSAVQVTNGASFTLKPRFIRKNGVWQ